MQQEANRKLGFAARRTMQGGAAALYEGVNVGGIGLVGLITYMRTDSLRIAAEAQAAASDFIKKKLRRGVCAKSYRVYKTKKNAQDAHEAVRPSDVANNAG